jgi:hypothetical protein
MPNVLAYTMSLDNRGFTVPLRQAEGLISGTVGKLGAAFAGLGIAFGAFKGIEGIVGAIREVAEGGLELKKLSTTTGQSVHDLVILQKAFKDVGIDADGVQSALFMLQKSLGGINQEGQPTKQIFEQLGLSIEGLKGRPAIEQLQSIGAAIGQLKDQESKAAAVSAIFSRFAGKEMLAILADPNAIKKAAADYGELASVQQKNAAAFAQLYLSMEKLKGKIANVFVGLTAQIAPQLNALLTGIRNSFDSLDIGKKIGDMLLTGFEAAKANKLGELIGLGISAGIEKYVPQIKRILEGPLNEWSAGVQARFESLPGTPYAGNKPSWAMTLLPGHGGDMDKWVAERQKQIMTERAAQPLEAPATDAQKAFDALVKSLQPAVEKTKQLAEAVTGLKGEEDKTKAPGTKEFSLSDLARASEGAKLTEGDRLARIGGFIGGGANRMADYARRTADNTQKLVDLISRDQSPATQTAAATYA